MTTIVDDECGTKNKLTVSVWKSVSDLLRSTVYYGIFTCSLWLSDTTTAYHSLLSDNYSDYMFLACHCQMELSCACFNLTLYTAGVQPTFIGGAGGGDRKSVV